MFSVATAENGLPHVAVPYADELISSWLGRTASYYYASWDELQGETRVPPGGVHDYDCDSKVISLLASKLCVDPDRIVAQDLTRAFPDQPAHRFVSPPENGIAGASFCVKCLKEDRAFGRSHYLRHEWALAGITRCQRHRLALANYCTSCLRNFKAQWFFNGDFSRLICAFCGHSQDEGKGGLWGPSNGIRDTVIDLEADMINALRNQDVSARWIGQCRPDIFLKVFEDIAFLLYRRIIGGPRSHLIYPINWFHGFLPGGRREGFHKEAETTFPLRSAWLYHRFQLIAATMCLLMPDQFISPEDAVIIGFTPSLAWLFEQLDENAQQMMLARAANWPDTLRARIPGAT